MKDKQSNALDIGASVQRSGLAELLKALGLGADYIDVQEALQALLQRIKELKASEELLRIVADYTYDWEYWLLPDGSLEYCSPSCKRITGYDVHEFLDDPELLDRIIHPEDVHIWQEHLQAADDKPEHLCAVFRIINRTGEVVWISHNCVAVYTEDRHYRGRRVSNRDISSRKQAQKEFEKKSEELDQYFKSSLDLLCIANIDGQLVRLNPEWENVLGYSISELQGRMFLDFVHPEDVESTVAAVSQLEKQEDVLNFVNRFRCKDGSYRWLEWRSKPMGRHIYAVARDITERRTMENALQKSEETFRNIVQSSPMGIHLYQLQEDDALIFTGANPAADRLLGVDHVRLIGKNIEEAFPPLKDTEVPDRYLRAARYGEAWHTEQIEYDHDGIAGAFEVHAFQMSPGNVAVLFSDITERKQAEKRLQQSQENLARTLESIGDGVIATDRQGRVVRMNPVAEKLCGWNELEARGRLLDEVFRIVNAVSREHLEDPVQKVFATGQVIGLANHTLLLSKTGEEFQIADSAAPIKDRNGNITGAVLVFRDVTKEYARDKVIKEEREQLLSIFNSIEGMIYISDPHTYEILHVNNKLASLLPRDCIGCRCYEAFQGLEAPCGFCTNHIILGNNNQPHKWEHYNPTLDRHFSIVDRIIKWPDGRNVRFEMAIDITERKRAEEALLESEEMQRKLLQAVPDLIIRTDMEGTITFVNELAFPGLENIPESNIYGRNFFSMIAGHDQPRAFKNARDRLHKNIGPQEYRLQFDDGTAFVAEVNGAVIRDRHTEAVGMVYVIRDISERKRASKEQEKLHDQFLQAQKMESLGILAGGVAHDFNNLLQTMSGNIELLMQDKPKDHPDAKRLQTVTQTMDRAAQLIEQLLFFSRKSGSRRVRVNLNQEVEGVCRILVRTIPKMIALEQHLDPSVWPLFADPVQIEQILLNLAGNAVDAMPEGGKLSIKTDNVVLEEDFVRMHPGASEGRHVLLTVSDTGRGMDKETLAHIFEPFFTTKEVGKGTGLGLASVYGIVQAHGGYIQCRSEPGQGATFRLYLPAGELVDEATEEPPPETAPRGGNETILVVDDEPEIRDLTREVLESLGYTVKSAATGEEALEIFRNEGQNIALVLLDLNMPGMGGYKCLMALLRIDPEIKVIIASGYTANGHGRDALSSDARGYIAKPYQLKELAAIIRKTLDTD